MPYLKNDENRRDQYIYIYIFPYDVHVHLCELIRRYETHVHVPFSLQRPAATINLAPTYILAEATS